MADRIVSWLNKQNWLMTEKEPQKALQEFWAAAHKKYRSKIRFGLDEPDRQRLREIEKHLTTVKPLSHCLTPGSGNGRR